LFNTRIVRIKLNPIKNPDVSKLKELGFEEIHKGTYKLILTNSASQSFYISLQIPDFIDDHQLFIRPIYPKKDVVFDDTCMTSEALKEILEYLGVI